MRYRALHLGVTLLVAVVGAVPPAIAGHEARNQISGADSILSAQPLPVVRKNPELAGAISVFLPGMGHIYAGETVKGAVLGGLFVGGIGAVIASDIGATHESIKTGGWASVCLVGAVYLYALIDAPFAADRENERAEQSRAHLLRFENRGAALVFDIGLTTRGPGAVLSITF